MKTILTPRTMAVAWCGAILILGVTWEASTVAHWLTLLAIAVPPPTILMYLWREPLPTMSERIRDALR